MTDELNITEYLASKGKHGRRGSGNEMVYACFFDCDRNDDDRKKKLYVNTVEGFYECKVCGTHGGTYLMQKFFGDDPQVTKVTGVDLQARRDILNAAARVGADGLAQNDEVLLYLIGRGLEAETIVDRQLGFIGNNWSLVKSIGGEHTKEEIRTTGLVYRDGEKQDKDFFWNHILIPYQSRGQVVQIRGRWPNDGEPKGGKYLTGPGEAVRIYNSDDLDKDDVIIVEGEFDCLMVRQLLDACPEDKYRDFGVVGVCGTQSLPENMVDMFASVKRIYTCFDPDAPGVKGALKVKELLGSRVRNLSFPAEVLLPAYNDGKEDRDIDWSLLIAKYGLTWHHIIAMVGSASGKKVFSISEAALLHRTLRRGKPYYQTGFDSLDQAIGGGMHAGQVMVLLAKTGVGKTTFLCNMAYYMRKYRILFFSLEMTREEVFGVMEKIYYFHHPTATPEALEAALGNVYICDENRLDERGFSQVIDEFETEVGMRPEVVMVDYLGYFARGAVGGSPYEKTNNAIMGLKAEAKGGGSSDPRRRFLCITPSQVNRGSKEGKSIDLDAARESGVIEETGDFVCSLFRPDDGTNVNELGGNHVRSNKVRMDINKSRGGGKGRGIDLIWDETFLVMVEANENTYEARKVKSHNAKSSRSVTYEQMRKEETAQVATQRKLDLNG